MFRIVKKWKGYYLQYRSWFFWYDSPIYDSLGTLKPFDSVGEAEDCAKEYYERKKFKVIKYVKGE